MRLTLRYRRAIPASFSCRRSETKVAGRSLGIQSPQEPQGVEVPAGVQRPTGATGSIGLTGPAGPAGPQGETEPQGTTGPAGATGAAGVIGPSWQGDYGSFYDTTTQTNPVANTARAITLNTTVAAGGISVLSNSRVSFVNTGVFKLEFTAQIQKSDAGTDAMDIWLSKNGQNVSDSNSQLVLTGSGVDSRTVVSGNFLFDADAGDYV